MDRTQIVQQLQQFPDSWLTSADVAVLLGLSGPKLVSQLKTRNPERFTAEEHHTTPDRGKSMEWSLSGIKLLCELASTDEAIATLNTLDGAPSDAAEDTHPHPMTPLEETSLQPAHTVEDTHHQFEDAFSGAPSETEDAYVNQVVAQLQNQTELAYANHLVERIQQGLMAQAGSLRENPRQVAPLLGEMLALRFGLSPDKARQVVGLA